MLLSVLSDDPLLLLQLVSSMPCLDIYSQFVSELYVLISFKHNYQSSLTETLEAEMWGLLIRISMLLAPRKP